MQRASETIDDLSQTQVLAEDIGIIDIMLKNCITSNKKAVIFIFTMTALCLLFSGCAFSQPDDAEQRDLFAMDTYMTLKAYGEHAEEALDAAEEEIHFLEKLLSTGNPESEISRLNSSGKMTLSDVSAYLYQRSLEVNAMSDGAFNPLIYPLVDAWGFVDKDYQVPDEKTIAELLSLLDLNAITYDENTRNMSFTKPGMMIDLGGIAKGYTSSRIMEIFQEHGVTSALVSLGGNVQVLGTKPDGSNYKVAIRDPENDSGYIGILDASDTAVITSGGYERYFEQDGKTYHHILDPQTGYPADSGLLSVTIVSSDGTLADGLSTALYVLGVEKGTQVWRSHPDLFDAVFLTKDHELYVTEGLQKDFQSQGYPVHFITLET